MYAGRNSLSNSPCPLGRARGRGRYNLLARAINNKPFQCSNGRDSPQRRRTAGFVQILRSLTLAHLCSILVATFYANNRWIRRPGPWPGAGAVTLGADLDWELEKGTPHNQCDMRGDLPPLRFPRLLAPPPSSSSPPPPPRVRLWQAAPPPQSGTMPLTLPVPRRTARATRP